MSWNLLKRTLQYHHGIIGRLRKHLSEKYHCEMDRALHGKCDQYDDQ